MRQMNYRKNGRKCGIGIKMEGKRTKKTKKKKDCEKFWARMKRNCKVKMT